MFLRKFFPQTKVELEARQAECGLNILLEILVFFAVFLVASLIEGLAVLIITLLYLIIDPSFLHSIMEAAMQISRGTISLQGVDQLMALYQPLINKALLFSLYATVLFTAAVILFCKQMQNRRIPSLGFRKRGALPEYLVGLVLGAGMFSLAVLLSGRTISISPANFSIGIILVYFLGYLLQGLSEEVLCRGYFMLSVARKNSILAAILANSLVFGLLHLPNSGFSWIAFLNMILFGIFASIWFLKRGSIWGVAAIHTAWNFVQGCVWGISVSGMPVTSSILTTELADGRVARLWNGGSFGLEGGFSVTIVLVAFCFLAFFLPANRSELAEAI